ncbi:hypothetical protein MKX03_020712 [Papaver bracteatum]|nr:hypothetical protein MKX03_020712 [Papaver bracteatum]
MFYLFFESRSKNNDHVVIWLTGGPGCSSELVVSNLLYVDQPTGTGFSYSSDSRDLRHNEEGVSNDLYNFLQHPQYAKNDFYITGDSYVGHHIPAFAACVRQGNKAKECLHIKLKVCYQSPSLCT